MLFAILDFFDYLVIGVLIALLAGGTTIASRRSGANAAAGERLRRVEDKLNQLMSHSGIDYVPSSKERWQWLAESNDRENAAKEYSESYSAPIEEAVEVVDQYLADFQRSTD